MDEANEQFDVEYTLVQLVEFADAWNDDDFPEETFNEEIDTWARRALAANGFGDY
jgi:hypothetical protein